MHEPTLLLPDPPTSPPASTGGGRAGGSAMACYRRQRAAEWALFVPTLPVRAAVAVATGAAVTVAAGQLAAGTIALTAGAIATLAAGWKLRFRTSADTRAWKHGAKGERLTARRLSRLARHGYVVFHDLQIPGSRANADHLAIGPAGTFLIDSKHYRGQLRLGTDGQLWYGRHPFAATLATVRWEAEQLTAVLSIAVEPVICLHGARLPWGELMAAGIPVLSPARLCPVLLALPPQHTPEQVEMLAALAQATLRPAAKIA